MDSQVDTTPPARLGTLDVENVKELVESAAEGPPRTTKAVRSQKRRESEPQCLEEVISHQPLGPPGVPGAQLPARRGGWSGVPKIPCQKIPKVDWKGR